MTRLVEAKPQVMTTPKAFLKPQPPKSGAPETIQPKPYSPGLTPLEAAGYITDMTLSYVREHYRGWDFHALHEDFKAWLKDDETRTPANYQKAFIGYVKRYHERNRYTL